MHADKLSHRRLLLLHRKAQVVSRLAGAVVRACCTESVVDALRTPAVVAGRVRHQNGLELLNLFPHLHDCLLQECVFDCLVVGVSLELVCLLFLVDSAFGCSQSVFSSDFFRLSSSGVLFGCVGAFAPLRPALRFLVVVAASGLGDSSVLISIFVLRFLRAG